MPIRAALWDIGQHISNLDQDAYAAKGYEFTTCSFHTIDGLTTLFLVFMDKESGKSHYVHLNEDTYDAQYGFREISTLVIEGMDFAVDDVFSKVISFRDFGSDQTIVLTDYGFWDVEGN